MTPIVGSWWQAPIWPGGPFTPQRLLAAAIILAAGLLLSWLARRALQRTFVGRGLDPGLRYAVGRLLQYALMGFSVLVAINTLGVSPTSLTVLGGALGIGVGFGLQTIASNFISGLILLFERPVRVGDRISLGTLDRDALGQVNGYVRSIRLRATSVETGDGIVLVVPNSELVTRTIVNWSLGDTRMRVKVEIGVAYDSDLDQVREIMLAAAREHPGTVKTPEPEVRLASTGDSALNFQVLVWVPDPIEHGRVEGDLRLEIVRRFRQAGIDIPFPQRVVHMANAQPTA
jgi:small-conductance mechanosensitive channel